MKFAAVIEYIQDKDKIAAIRPVHRQYLASLKELPTTLDTNKPRALRGPPAPQTVEAD